MAIITFILFAYLSALVSSITSATHQPFILSRQCWHETPFSTVLLHSTVNGLAELAVPADAPSDNSSFAFGAYSHPPQPQLDHYPWTHPPLCTESLETLGSALCIYTNASFHNGRGISIVTTPILANHFASLPAFQDAAALEEVNVFSGSWHTQELPGKGVGMLAKKALKPKDRITIYTPVLIALLESELSTAERETLYRTAVSQLPDSTLESYLELAYVYGMPEIRFQDIVKANTFQLEIIGHNHLAVFPEPSRLNHACGPNAQYVLDPSLLTHVVHATRPIAEGEEITISYTSPTKPTAERNQHLQSGFHFTCTCARCLHAEASDATLHTIHTLQAQLNDWSETRSSATPGLAEQLIQLYIDEGLEGFLDVPYGFAALAYNAVGDFEKARAYAVLAREVVLLKDGVWTSNMDIWESLMREPEKHWSFQRQMQGRA